MAIMEKDMADFAAELRGQGHGPATVVKYQREAAAFAASTVSSPSLVKLIDGLGGAFGLLLGTVASCALLLLVSLISSLMVVAV